MRLRRTTWDENGASSVEETGQSVIQASLDAIAWRSALTL